MSTRLSRARRTKVYDCNYNIGERYYRPVVDDLDRKYSGRGSLASAATAAEDSLSSLRATLSDSESRTASSLSRAARREIEEDVVEEPRRRPVSTLLDDYDSIFENRSKSSGTKSRALAVIDDDAGEFGVSANLKRIRAARAARAQAMEEEMTSTTSRSKPSLEYAEKVLDTVGLKNSDIGKARLALADDSLFSKRTLKITSSSEAESESTPKFTKWSKVSAVGSDSDVDETLAAAARARKSRARIADLEAEMDALADRTAAREKRAAGLRALVAENEANASANASSSSSSKMVATSVKKVSSSVTSEKKTVTF